MQIFRQDSNAMPIMSLGIEGNYDRVTLREMAENQIGPRLERAEGVAAVTTDGRPAPSDSRPALEGKDCGAGSAGRPDFRAAYARKTPNTPLGEVNQGERTYLLRSQGQVQSLDEIRNLVLMTRGGVPIYVRDVAEVVDTTEDVRSLLRINGLPGVRLSVQKQSGTNTVQVAQGIRDEIARINAEMPNIKLNVPRRQLGVHQQVDSLRAGARADRRSPRHADHLPVPAQLPLDAHRLHVDPDFCRSARSPCSTSPATR
jgi:HAE1 family hydrophobic/amphiphilic exporter-1